MIKKNKLVRPKNDRLVAGVCSGIGNYLGVDSTVVRLVWALITIFTAFVPGIIAYFVAAIIIPEK